MVNGDDLELVSPVDVSCDAFYITLMSEIYGTSMSKYETGRFNLVSWVS